MSVHRVFRARNLMAVLACMLATSVSLGQDVVDASKQHALVQKFAGNWTFTMDVSLPDGSKDKTTGTFDAKASLSGRAVTATLAGTSDMFGPVEMVFIFAYETETGIMHMMNAGGLGPMWFVHDHDCIWLDDKTMMGTWSGLSGGKSAREDFVFTFASDKELHIKERDTEGGVPGALFDMVFKKK